MLGVSAPTRGSLVLRKTTQGLLLERAAPGAHEFCHTFLARELNESVRVWVVVPVDPPLYYEVTAISPKGDLEGHLVEVAQGQRVRWWQRWRRRGRR